MEVHPQVEICKLCNGCVLIEDMHKSLQVLMCDDMPLVEHGTGAGGPRESIQLLQLMMIPKMMKDNTPAGHYYRLANVQVYRPPFLFCSLTAGHHQHCSIMRQVHSKGGQDLRAVIGRHVRSLYLTVK